MGFYYKVSKRDFMHFRGVVQSSYPFDHIFQFSSVTDDGCIITEFCLDDVEIAQSVKPVGKRVEYFINPFWKEALK